MADPLDELIQSIISGGSAGPVHGSETTVVIDGAVHRVLVDPTNGNIIKDLGLSAVPKGPSTPTIPYGATNLTADQKITTAAPPARAATAVDRLLEAGFKEVRPGYFVGKGLDGKAAAFEAQRAQDGTINYADVTTRDAKLLGLTTTATGSRSPSTTLVTNIVRNALSRPVSSGKTPANIAKDQAAAAPVNLGFDPKGLLDPNTNNIRSSDFMDLLNLKAGTRPDELYTAPSGASIGKETALNATTLGFDPVQYIQSQLGHQARNSAEAGAMATAGSNYGYGTPQYYQAMGLPYDATFSPQISAAIGSAIRDALGGGTPLSSYSNPPPAASDPTQADSPLPAAAGGGAMLATQPTFLVQPGAQQPVKGVFGEAGPERATFQPQGGAGFQPQLNGVGAASAARAATPPGSGVPAGAWDKIMQRLGLGNMGFSLAPQPVQMPGAA